ncbi:hypothetical protein BJF90_45155 [Pseudonocardia sp. CNS-004]|nr:hypothetical protein BJF90_45155 [Pseudonocardia sp. CNS-004]
MTSQACRSRTSDRSEAAARNQTSCVTSSASATVPRIRYAAPNTAGRCVSHSASASVPVRPTFGPLVVACRTGT